MPAKGNSVCRQGTACFLPGTGQSCSLPRGEQQGQRSGLCQIPKISPNPQAPRSPRCQAPPVNLNTQTLFKLILPLWRPPNSSCALAKAAALPTALPFPKSFPVCPGVPGGGAQVRQRSHTHTRVSSSPSRAGIPIPNEGGFLGVMCVGLEDLSPSIISSPSPGVGALLPSRWILPLPNPGTEKTIARCLNRSHFQGM